MRFKIFTTGLLLGLMASCSGIKPNHIVYSTPKQQASEPRVTEPTDTPSNISASADSIGKAAKLTPQQLKELIDVAKGLDFKVIVPEYIPSASQIDLFKVGKDGYGPYYQIIYRNSSNSCFEIYANSGGWGDGATDFRTVKVFSQALGEVTLGYTDFDRVTRAPYIAFDSLVIINSKQGYSFFSPAAGGRYKTRVGNQECRSISFEEAKKIVASLKYLNH